MPEVVDASQQSGAYKVLLHGRDINKVEHKSEVITLNADGTVNGDYTGIWACADGVNVTLTLGEHTYTGVMHTALDASQRTWVTCISALDEEGAALWATRAYSNYKD